MTRPLAQFLRLEHGLDLPLPHFATPGSAGMDVYAAVEKPLALEPMARALVPLGFAMALPLGFEAQIRPRSGLAIKQGITVINAPATIDCDYRGELKVPLINLGNATCQIERGDRIAQMVIAAYSHVEWQLVDTLDETQRGAGGFGSTGKR